MKNVRHTLWVFFVVIFVFPLAAFSAPEESITIGLLASQTGPMTFQGTAITRGFTLALDEASNRVAGKNIKVVVEDEVVSPAIALTKTHETGGERPCRYPGGARQQRRCRGHEGLHRSTEGSLDCPPGHA